MVFAVNLCQLETIVKSTAAAVLFTSPSKTHMTHRIKKRRWTLTAALLVAIIPILGWRAALGFAIGLALGTVAGLLVGVSIAFMLGAMLEAYGKREPFHPFIDTLIRLGAGCAVGALHGALFGVAASQANSWANMVVGTAVGALVGMVLATKLLISGEVIVRAETNSLESTAVGIPIGALLGAIIGATRMPSGGLMELFLSWLHHLLAN